MEFNPYPDPFVYLPQGRAESVPAEFGSRAAPGAEHAPEVQPAAAPMPRQTPSLEPQPPMTSKWPEPAAPLPQRVASWPQTSIGPESEASLRQPEPSTPFPAGPDQELNVSEFEEVADDDEFSKRSPWSFVGFFIVIGFIIGGWYFFSNSGTPLSPPVGEKTPDLQPNLIAASLGGTIRNGGASVIIPPGALTSDMEIFIKRIAEGTQENATDLYYLEPHGYQFLKPVTVIIPYKKNPSRLKYTQNGASKYTPFAIDQASKTIRIEVMEF